MAKTPNKVGENSKESKKKDFKGSGVEGKKNDAGSEVVTINDVVASMRKKGMKV